jgi:hypothetical protein
MTKKRKRDAGGRAAGGRTPGRAAGDRVTGPRVRGGAMALRGRCRVRYDFSRADFGGLASSLIQDITEDSRGIFDLLLTDDRQRVTYAAGGRKAFTAVYRRQGGMTFWDDATRSFATIGAEDMPRTTIAPGTTETTRPLDGGDEGTFVVTTRDPKAGTLRHELTVSRRKEWAPFGAALLRVLHCGPSCHAQTGLPWDEIAKAGVIIRERTFVDGANEPITELELESLELVKIGDGDFAPPRGYRPLEEIMKKGGEPRPYPAPSPADPKPEDVQAGVVKQGLEDSSGGGGVKRAFLIREDLTPDCLGNTRFGSMSASIHQDLLTVVTNAVNTVAPLIGPTTIAGTTWTVPWLANLAAATAAAPAGLGSGLFCFLRQRRNPMLPPGPGGGGGAGLVDAFAFSTLYQRDAAGLMRTQREFTAGTLPITLARWGVGAPTDANLIAAAGDLTMVSLLDQRTVTEAYELTELGVITVTAPASTLAPFSFGSVTFAGITTPPLFTVSVGALSGTVNFASLAGGPLITAATVGSSGNFVLGLTPPAASLSAIVVRAPTLWAGFVMSVGAPWFCITFPFFCPIFVTLVSLAWFVMLNVTLVTATTIGVTWTLDVRFDFDPATERVEPFVSVLGTTGTAVVAAIGLTPNLIANLVDALVGAFGTLFNTWSSALAGGAATALQQLLRSQGLQLPVAGRQNELRAIDGGATSSPGAVLQLHANVVPIVEGLASQPFTTQVARTNVIDTQLLVAHLNIRRDLNPQPAVPPPGPGPVLTVGTLVGLGLSQNALNYYLFHQWVNGLFEVTITDAPTINKFEVNAPPGLFVRSPVRIHMWPAVAPRVEIAPHAISLGTRPLVVYFDDVRACFEIPNMQGADGTTGTVGAWELCCNFKTSGTITLAWPWVFSLRVDPPTMPGSPPYEPMTWEFIDPNVPAVMATLKPTDFNAIVEIIARFLIAPISALGIQAPAGPRPWTRPLPAMQQEIVPTITPPLGLPVQRFYMEIMARHKSLYVLPAIDSTIMELFDGSGAPVLNGTILPLLGAPPPLPTTVLAMTCPQGTALRTLVPLLLPLGP